MQPGLGALLHPRSTAELRASYEANEPFVVHGQKASIGALTRLPFLASLEALLTSWPDPVSAHLPDVADEASSIEASTRDARKLFASGMGLLFDDAHTSSPELARWLEAVRRDVGLSALTHGRCLIYATPGGKGTAPHFDQNVNFVLQLHGTKTWQLAANHHVIHPMTRHTMGQPVDAELQTYAQPMPTTMPQGSQSIVLEPGSLLFVPRGVWHSTLAASDALSLNFTYSAPTWLDVLTAAMRGRLALSRAWRQTALPAAAHQLDALLRELAEELPHWSATDILAATEGEGKSGEGESGEGEGEGAGPADATGPTTAP